MEIETVPDLANKIADMLGVYGVCRLTLDERYDKNRIAICPYEVSTCCRVKFVGLMESRIREAVANEKKLNQIPII